MEFYGIIIIIAVVIIFLVLFFHFIPVTLWISALAANVKISVWTLVGMRLRRVVPARIVNAMIKAGKAGLDISINKLEAHYLAGGNVDRVVNSLIAAQRADIGLEFERAAAIDLIVQQTRLPDGSRKIVAISEVTGREADVILLQDIFTCEQEGFDERGRVVGHHTATGNIPYFVDELRKSGNLKIDMSVFVPKT